jgi:hypothetical protein
MITENRSDWRREVLVISDPKYILSLETALLLSLDAKNDPLSYNKHNGDGIYVSFGDDHHMRNPEIAKKMGEAHSGDNHWTKKKPADFVWSQVGQKRPSITGDKHPNKKPENAAKISRSHIGKKHSYAEGSKNVMCKPEIAAKISGSNHWMNNTPRCECEFCGIRVVKSNYTRWHGSNCKQKGI